MKGPKMKQGKGKLWVFEGKIVAKSRKQLIEELEFFLDGVKMDTAGGGTECSTPGSLNSDYTVRRM